MQQVNENHHFTERRLLRAASRVRDNWIPIQEEQLRDYLREAFKDDTPPAAKELLQFLKSDLSLYLFSVLRLFECLADQGEEAPESLSLSDLLDRVGVTTLVDILNVEAVQCSRFSLCEATQNASDKIQEALIAAAVTESCAEAHALDRDEAYCASVLRQLGMLLITWNYPGLYEEALLNVSETVSCEEWLAKELGFTPQELALVVCHSSCNIKGRVFEQYLDDELFAERKESLFHVCRLGESLAKARYPQYYRFEKATLSEAYTQLDILGGSHLINQIQGSFETLVSRYQRSDTIIRTGSNKELAMLWRPDRSDEDDEYCLKLLPESLRSSLSDFYSLLRYEVEAKRLVHMFMTQLVKAARFDGGALYSFDPEKMELVRRAGTGTISDAIGTTILYDPLQQNRDIVQLAYDTETVLIEYTKDVNGQQATGCAVSFGLDAKIGVLYVQLAEVPADEAGEKAIVEKIGLLKKALEEALLLATY